MTQPGRDFELVVKAAIESQIQSGTLGVVPNLAKVFHRKSYPSPYRGQIVTDVSVELFHPDAEEAWLLWIWECKDYGHRVPVDDVEEFHAKLEQMGQHRTKGTLACRDGFQSGAVGYANGVGISLVRLLPDGSITAACSYIDSHRPPGGGPAAPSIPRKSAVFA